MSDFVGISFKVIKGMPVTQIAQWEDNVVYGIARKVLDLTNTGRHFPYLSGDLNRASMSEGVVKEAPGTYHLGARRTDYAEQVWEMGSGTHWTNDRTLPQWYISVYEKYNDIVLNSAINYAKKETL